MIVGIGSDVCDIRRIERSLRRYGRRFISTVFTDEEQSICDAAEMPAISYARCFAAKEACSKALGAGISPPLSWHEIQINDEPDKRPMVKLAGYAFDRLAELICGSVAIIHISLAHDASFAHASVVIEAER